jgi:hypothetical protein
MSLFYFKLSNIGGSIKKPDPIDQAVRHYSMSQRLAPFATSLRATMVTLLRQWREVDCAAVIPSPHH